MSPERELLIADAAAVLGWDAPMAAVVVRSPGRVNLIGEHIDYSGGLVLPMALDRGTTAVVAPRADRVVRGYSANFPAVGVVEASLEDVEFDAAHEWFSYFLGVVAVAMSDGLRPTHGFDAFVVGDLPDGAGLSSSASVELAAATALEALFGFGLTPTEWAVLCQRAENTYIGVACGIMDQLAIALGRQGHAVLMDCSTLRCDPVPIPTDRATVVIANTNRRRSLAESNYNDRRAAVERAGALLGQAIGTPVGRLVDVTPQQLADHEVLLRDEGVLAEARHTVTEHQRVIATAAALRAGDLPAVGRLMRESHESLRDDFGVTGRYLDALAEAAWNAPGVIGARMTGAGFGGCTVNLVAADRVADAMAAIADGYQTVTGIEPEVFPVTPSDGAHVVLGS